MNTVRIRPIFVLLGLLLAGPAAAQPRFGAFISGGHLCDMIASPHYATTRGQWDARGVPLSYLVGFVSFDAMPGYDELEVLPGQTVTRIEANLECAWREGAAVLLNWGRHPWVDASGQPAYATGSLTTLYPPHEGYYRLYAWANALARWTAKGDGRVVYLIPFPEANGPWTPYYTADPGLYRDAHGMIEWIMRYYAPAVRVAWGPWLMATHGVAWKAYAPGTYHTLAPSLYAGGNCGGESTLYSYDVGIAGPLAELRAFGKPIILAQTGVHADPPTAQAWAEEFHRRVATEPGVVGVAWWDPAPADPACGFKVADWTRVLRSLDWRQ